MVHPEPLSLYHKIIEGVKISFFILIIIIGILNLLPNKDPANSGHSNESILNGTFLGIKNTK